MSDLDPDVRSDAADGNDPSLDLVPARALNQVLYCPRLYFLQYVDGVMPVNEHVEAGRFDHRRVDDPDLRNRTRTEGETAVTRSVALASPALGVTAVLDVVEEADGELYPVETKHGSAPYDADGRPTVWPNDAVQLCAQALLLEEATGRPVPRGFQYYAGSKERVEVRFTDELRRQTREAVARCRELAARDAPPDPLPPELRNRCFGCSLAPVCLPEETLYHLTHPRPDAADQPGPAALTRVIPQADDGAVLYVQEPGASVGRQSEHLVVRKHGQELARVPLHAVRHVVVCGPVQVSTQALQTLAANDIPVSYVTVHGRFIGAFLPAPTKNVCLREAQYRVFNDPLVRLRLAKAVVRAKLANQRTLLMRQLRDEGGSQLPAARGLYDLLRALDDAADLDTVLGLEGQGAALYFAEFGRFLKRSGPGRPFDFTTRNRRPPSDPVNALLSLAYTLLARDCFSAACTVGFDPYKGFYHGGKHGKPSLALDLMEEFRPVIADSVVITLINNDMLKPADFLVWKDAYQLAETGRKVFFQAYEQRKATVVTHPVYGYRMSYSRMIEVQARMLAAYVRGNIPNYTGFTVR